MRRVRRGLAALLSLVVPALLLAGCSSSGGDVGRGDGTTSASPSGSGSPAGSAATEPRLARFYEQRLSWHGCSGGFECARLTVPVDYADPNGGSLRLAVNRLPSSGSHRGSLVVNPGGPGVSGLGYARSARSAVSQDVREHYDVVGFDPRGVGASRPIDCLTDRQLDAFLAQDGTPDSPAEEAELRQQGELLGDGCLRADPALAAHMGTRDVARDMDVLRAVLGDDTLTYLGKSYGTYLGALYADLFPDDVGRLVLDGPVDPSATDLDNARAQATGFQRALDSFVDDCLRRASCPLSGTRAGAEARLKALLDRTDSRPLAGLGRRQATQALATYGLAIGLYDESYWPFLRQGIGQALRGEGRNLLLLADLYNDRGPGGRYTTNASEAIYAVDCLDRADRSTPDQLRADATEVARLSPIFGAYIAWSSLPCTTWPVPAEGDPAPVHAAGSAPILVVGTTRDPATPYESAQALAQQLDAGHLLTRDGDGHTAYRLGSACIDQAVDDYLLDGTLPAAGARCR
jgi:pimeloyl-ACP methyl ester carboxylesterase